MKKFNLFLFLFLFVLLLIPVKIAADTTELENIQLSPIEEFDANDYSGYMYTNYQKCSMNTSNEFQGKLVSFFLKGQAQLQGAPINVCGIEDGYFEEELVGEKGPEFKELNNDEVYKRLAKYLSFTCPSGYEIFGIRKGFTFKAHSITTPAVLLGCRAKQNTKPSDEVIEPDEPEDEDKPQDTPSSQVVTKEYIDIGYSNTKYILTTYEDSNRNPAFTEYTACNNDNSKYKFSVHKNQYALSEFKLNSSSGEGNFAVTCRVNSVVPEQHKFTVEIISKNKKVNLPEGYYYKSPENCVGTDMKMVQFNQGYYYCAYVGDGNEPSVFSATCSNSTYESYKVNIPRSGNKSYPAYICRQKSIKFFEPSTEDAAANGCNLIPDDLRNWIRGTLNFVKYAALALVVILGVVDFIKAATTGEAESMKKSGQDFLKRIIAVVVLFLLPVIIDLILNLIEIYGPNSTCV